VGVRGKIIWCAVIVAAIAAVVFLELKNRVPFNSVVEIDMSESVEEQAKAGSGGATVHEITDAIDLARDDRHVGGIVVKMGDANGRPAALKEIGAHIAAFRKTGKGSICFYDDEDDDLRAETLASACEQKLGQGAGNDDEIEGFFDVRLGDDNWYPIEMGEYLRRVRERS
jgi:hypothetical protein